MFLFGTQIGGRYGFEGVVEKFNDFMRCRPLDYASFTIFSANGVIREDRLDAYIKRQQENGYIVVKNGNCNE